MEINYITYIITEIGGLTIPEIGIISKSTLLILGGTLIISGIIAVEIRNELSHGAIEILLGGFLILIREWCKTLPDGTKDNK